MCLTNRICFKPWANLRRCLNTVWVGGRKPAKPTWTHTTAYNGATDANILPGQIKNNLDFRVCGRADNVLSQIILDNTSAADQIPKDARGRFITGDGTAFQACLFDKGTL